MRRMLHGDIVAAARVLLLAPEEERRCLCQRMIDEAEKAYAHFEKCGKPHPDWGTGSLMSAALQRPAAPEPSFDNVEYLTCLKTVFREITVNRLLQIRNGRS